MELEQMRPYDDPLSRALARALVTRRSSAGSPTYRRIIPAAIVSLAICFNAVAFSSRRIFALPWRYSVWLALAFPPSFAPAQVAPNFDDALELVCPPFEPVLDRTQRFAGLGYSVLPPSTGYWCHQSAMPAMLLFHAVKLDADVSERPSREFLAHTLVVSGMTYTIPAEELARFSTLEDLLRAWMEQGRGVRAADRGILYIELTPSPGFTHVSSSFSVDDSIGTDCVRYENDLEERGNRGVPRNWILLLRSSGVVCRHPDAADVLIDVAFSERMREGQPHPDPAASRALLAAAQATLGSLRFEPIVPP